MKPQILLPPVLGIAGIALGIVLGRGPFSPKTVGSDGEIIRTHAGGSVPANGSIYERSADGTANGKGADGKKNSPAVNAAADALLGVINNPNGQSAVNGFYSMLGKMPSGDIADLIIDVDKYPNHSRRRETREMIIDYLAMADPIKALEVHKTLPTKGIFGKAFKQLGRTDPAAALRIRDDLEDAGEKKSALTSIFVGASEVDPAGAFELLKSSDDASPQLYHEVFDNWAETDPVSAAKMALTVEKPAERREALKIVGQEWAERDPQAVLDWIGQTELSSYEREIIRTSALSAYSRRDAKAAMALIADLDPAVRNRALPKAVQELMQQDPAAAVEWIREEPDSFAKFRSINDSIYELARKAPDATIDLAKEYPEIKKNALSSAFGTLASNDLQAALTKSDEWRDDPQYASIIGNIASSYGRQDPEEALKWANGLDGNARSNAIRSVIGRLSGDPTLALKHLDSLGLPQEDPIYMNSVQNIAGNWSREDPVSAAEWIQGLPASDTQAQLIGQVADGWARVDPVSASEWIGEMDQGPARDQAASQLVQRIQRDDPEMAVAWAGSIADENQRNNTLSNVFSNWIRMDPNSALAALQEAPLPEQTKQSYIRRIEARDNPSVNGRPASAGSIRGGFVEDPFR